MTNLIQEKLQEFRKKFTYFRDYSEHDQHGTRGVYTDLKAEEIEDFLESSLQSMQEETRREIQRELRGDLLPIMIATSKWLLAHQGADEIITDTIEDEDHVTQRPWKAIYYSPLYKFQSVSLSSPKQELKDTNVPKCKQVCHGEHIDHGEHCSRTLNVKEEVGKDTDVPSKCHCHCHYKCEGTVYRNGVEVAHCKCMQIHCEHCTPEAEKPESMKEEK